MWHYLLLIPLTPLIILGSHIPYLVDNCPDDSTNNSYNLGVCRLALVRRQLLIGYANRWETYRLW